MGLRIIMDPNAHIDKDSNPDFYLIFVGGFKVPRAGLIRIQFRVSNYILISINGQYFEDLISKK